MIYLSLIILICYVMQQMIEAVSYGARVSGKLTGRLSLGATLQHSIFMGSKLFAVPTALLLAYLIESNISITTYFLLSAILTFTAFLASISVFIKLDYFQILFQKLYYFYDQHTVPVAITKVFFSRKRNKINVIHCQHSAKKKTFFLKKIFVSYVAYFFLSTGFLFAFSMAILIPEYRLTMSQFSTAFQGVGVIVLAFYIDPMLSRSIDNNKSSEVWIDNIYSILLGKLIAYLFATIIFIFSYFYFL